MDGTKAFLACALALLLAGGLQACCFRTGDAGKDGGAAPAGDADPGGTLGITGWGPQRTRAGIPFNVQPGGHAAIWIRVDRPLDGRVVLIRFDDAVLEGQASGRLVTAVVPAELYARRGTRAVRVIVRQGESYRSSNTVEFTVQ